MKIAWLLLLRTDVTAFITIRHTSTRLFLATTSNTASEPSCWYRNSSTDNKWKKRINFRDLKFGQELQGIVVKDLLNGRTGPKVYLDCGICRNKKDNFESVNALLRLPRAKKMSVLQKKAQRLRKQTSITVFVSRIYRSNYQFEVVLEREEAKKRKPLQSTSQLRVGDTIEAIPVRYTDYGVFVTIPNYNRGGLLHIQTVADAYDRYIDKQKGLKELVVPTELLELQVKSNASKRLFLDFTESFKQTLRPTREEATEQEANGYDVEGYDENYDEEEEEDDYIDEDYDEDRDIEDALGLGSY